MPSRSSVRVCIFFPYRTTDQLVFEKLALVLQAVVDPQRPLNTSKRKAVMVLNRDTLEGGGHTAFLKFLRKRHWEYLADAYVLHTVRAPDTCANWIYGWDIVLQESDGAPRDERDDGILQLPGDLRAVQGNFQDFIGKVRTLALKLQAADLVIGDFDAEPVGSKALIDTYGTFPLLLTWFPHAAADLRERCRIGRPRSEFVALSLPFLRANIHRRKFSYEQTLAFLIYAIELPQKWRVDREHLGDVSDWNAHRGFKEAMDQIERTERMLRMLWREMNTDSQGLFSVEDYESLDKRSTAMREAAMIIFENYLAANRRDRPANSRGTAPVPASGALSPKSKAVRVLKEPAHTAKSGAKRK